MFDEKIKKKINEILNKDGVIAFVTDTVWGLGCLPSSKKAVEKIYEIKNRDTSKPLILMSNEIDNLVPYVDNFCEKAKNLSEKYLPGALTLVLEKSDLTKEFITSNKNTVGIRIPDNKVFQELCAFVDGHVLATTSANHSGEPPALTYEQALEFVGEQVDLVIDDFGYIAKGIPSTVVGVEDEKVIIFRQGQIEIFNN